MARAPKDLKRTALNQLAAAGAAYPVLSTILLLSAEDSQEERFEHDSASPEESLSHRARTAGGPCLKQRKGAPTWGSWYTGRAGVELGLSGG